MALKERLKEGWIHCNLIVEIIGKPKEYVDKVMGEVVEAIGKIDGVELINKNIHEAKEAKTYFSTFSEVEVAVKDLKILTDLVFAYMPSNIEILSPNEIKMSLNDCNLLVNLLTSKLHGYDAITKKLKLENMILRGKLHKLGALPEQKQKNDELESLKSEESEGSDNKEQEIKSGTGDASS